MSAPSPLLDDEKDPTRFLQIENATRSLEHTLQQDQPSAEIVSASLKEGAMLNRLDPWAWYQPLIQNDMIHSLCEIIDHQGGLLPFAEERLAHALIESGSNAMFQMVFQRIKMLPESLFQALGHAVEKDNVQAASKLLSVGAALYDPHPHGTQRLGGVLCSAEMFELLRDHGYVFKAEDVLTSALAAQCWTRSTANYEEAPRPELLAHMLEAGLLNLPSIECNPWMSLLRSRARIIDYREQIIACATLLIDKGDIDLPRRIHLAGLWVLMKAGCGLDALRKIASHSEPWEQEGTRNMASLVDLVMDAREMLMELDEAGLKMETLYPLSNNDRDWERAFALAGCDMDESVVSSVLRDSQIYLREHALLHRQTQATKQDPETTPPRRRL